MNRSTLKMSLFAASMLAAFGAARADTITSVSSDRIEPKCIDSENTQPAGCTPSAPLAGSSSTTTTDVTPGIAAVPGSSSSSTTVNGAITPGSSSTSTDVNVNGTASVPSTSGTSSAPASSSTDTTQKPDTGTSSTQ